MMDKELRKLSRRELLQMLVVQVRETGDTKQELAETTEQRSEEHTSELQSPS